MSFVVSLRFFLAGLELAEEEVASALASLPAPFFTGPVLLADLRFLSLLAAGEEFKGEGGRSGEGVAGWMAGCASRRAGGRVSVGEEKQEKGQQRTGRVGDAPLHLQAGLTGRGRDDEDKLGGLSGACTAR